MRQCVSQGLFHKILIIIALLSFNGVGLAAYATGVISHQPVYKHPPGEPLLITATVSSGVEVESVDLFYRRAGEEGYIDVEMIATAEGWYGAIPPEEISMDGVEYFISATLVDTTVITYPEETPQDAPIFVQIVPPAQEKVPEQVTIMPAGEKPVAGEEAILVFSPAPGAKVAFDEVMIAVSLFNIDSVDISSVKVYLDGRDVTARAEVGVDLVIYEPPSLFPGMHQARVEVTTSDGQPVASKTWSFEAVREVVEELAVERAFSYQGRVNGSYSYDKIDEGNPLRIGMTTAAFSGSWRTVRFKADLKLTSEEDPFKQPRNRYKFTVNAGRFLSLNLGDFNTRISPFTLDGKRVRGVDLDIKLGFVNLQVVRGELDRSIQGRFDPDASILLDRVVVEQNPIDSTKYDFLYEMNRKGYAFQKDIFAGRLSFGSGKTFQLGLNWLKAKDDILSVDTIVEDAKITVDVDSAGTLPLAVPLGIYTYSDLADLIASQPNYNLPEETNWAGNAPQDNIVIGSDVKVSLFRHKLGFEGGWAFSMLNTNIRDGAFTKSELDTLGALNDTTLDGKLADSFDIPFSPEKYEDIFVMNLNQIPLIPIDLDSTQLADDPFKAIVNMPSLSYNFRATANVLRQRLGFEYISVGPEFNSLGNPYIQKNNREYTISDRVGLFRNRLMFNVRYRHQDDDILRTVEHVTTTNTVTVNTGIYPGANLPSMTVSYRMQDRDNGTATLDTVRTYTDTPTNTTNYELEDLRDSTKTTNIGVGLSHRITVAGFENSVAVSYILLDREDQFDDRPARPYYSVTGGDTLFIDSTFVSPNVKSNVVNVSVVTDYPFPLKTTAVVSINNSVFGIPDDKAYDYGNQDITSILFNGTYDIFQGRLKLLGGVEYTVGSGREEFSRSGIRGGFNYRITDVLRFRLDAGFRSKNIGGESKGSTIARASLNYSF